MLPRNTAGRLALLQEAGLVNDRHRVLVRPVRDDTPAHNIAQRIGIPAAPSQDRLLSPGAGSTGRFRPQPPRLAPLLPRQAIKNSKLSRNRPADAATRSCMNNRRLRTFTSHSDAAWTCPALVERHWVIWQHAFRTEPGL